MSHQNNLYFQSTLEIVETAWEYITQLKAQAQTTMDMTEDAQSKNRSIHICFIIIFCTRAVMALIVRRMVVGFKTTTCVTSTYVSSLTL